MRNALISIWICTVLIATMGVSVQSIYCYCTGKTSVALFVNYDNEHENCCIEEVNSCCATEQCKNTSKKPCTSSEAQYVQLKLDFSIEKTEKQRAAPIAVANILHNSTFTVFFFLEKVNPAIADRAPPRRAGRQLLPFIESWLC